MSQLAIDKKDSGQAIKWVQAEKSLTPDKPFFIYFAPGSRREESADYVHGSGSGEGGEVGKEEVTPGTATRDCEARESGQEIGLGEIVIRGDVIGADRYGFLEQAGGRDRLLPAAAPAPRSLSDT
jgi:hypothetical protein